MVHFSALHFDRCPPYDFILFFGNEHDGLIKNILAYFKKKHGIYTTGQTYLDIKTLLEKE